MKSILDLIVKFFSWLFSHRPKLNPNQEITINRELNVEPKIIIEDYIPAIREQDKKLMAITGPQDHVNATPVIREAWKKIHNRDASPLETLYTQAIASLETGYGRIGQFGNLAAQGKFNWGGLQKAVNADGTCPDGFALGKDQGNVCFFVFPSDIDAAAQMIKELTLSRLRPGVIDSMKGSPEDVATAMRGNDLGKPPEQNRTAWYEGIRGTPEADRIKFYANLIRSHAKTIGGALSKHGIVIENSSAIGTAMVLLGIGLGGAYWYAKHKT